MEPRISIITLGVADLERAIDFYQEGLKLPRYAWDGDIAFFETAGTWLALFPREALAEDAGVSAAGNGFSGVTLAHIVRSRADVDRLMDQAEVAGAQLVKAPEEKSWGGYSGTFADPDGYLWEIAWNPHFPLDKIPPDEM